MRYCAKQRQRPKQRRRSGLRSAITCGTAKSDGNKWDILLEGIKWIAALEEALNSYKSFVDLDSKRLPQGAELDTHWAWTGILADRWFRKFLRTKRNTNMDRSSTQRL